MCTGPSTWQLQCRLTDSEYPDWQEVPLTDDTQGAELLLQVLSVMPETVRILSDALFPNVSWTVSSASLTVL